MGILNVTPDSFSGDGLATAGRSEDEIVSAALERARGFVAAGAEILDVGAESTRPASVYGERAPVEVMWREHQEARADHGHALWALLTLAVWLESTVRS